MKSIPKPENHKSYESEFALDGSFDFAQSADTNFKYLILSSPRSGSTLLSSALHNTGLAGVPLEYFHQSVLQQAGNPERSHGDLRRYIGKLHNKRTSPNGVFGMKLHYGQFKNVYISNPEFVSHGVEFLKEHQKIILIYRRDKILQAISAMLSSEKNIWSTRDSELKGSFGRAYREEDAITIAEFIKRHTFQELSWRKLLKDLGLSYIEVSYEDLTEGFEQEFRKVIEFLEISGVQNYSLQDSTIKTSNLRFTTELKRAFLKAIGVDASFFDD